MTGHEIALLAGGILVGFGLRGLIGRHALRANRARWRRARAARGTTVRISTTAPVDPAQFAADAAAWARSYLTDG